MARLHEVWEQHEQLGWQYIAAWPTHAQAERCRVVRRAFFPQRLTEVREVAQRASVIRCVHGIHGSLIGTYGGRDSEGRHRLDYGPTFQPLCIDDEIALLD